MNNPMSPSLRWITGISAGAVLMVLGGSYTYTYSVSAEVREAEKRIIKGQESWRDAHNQSIGKRLDTIEDGQKELKKDLNKKLDKFDERQEKRYDKIDRQLERLIEQKRRVP